MALASTFRIRATDIEKEKRKAYVGKGQCEKDSSVKLDLRHHFHESKCSDCVMHEVRCGQGFGLNTPNGRPFRHPVQCSKGKVEGGEQLQAE